MRRTFHKRPETCFRARQSLLCLLALRNITVDDHKFLWLALFVADHAGHGFQHHPIAFLVTEAIFQSCSHPRLTSLCGSLLNLLAVVRMNLFEPRRLLEFFRRISQYFLVRETVENPAAFQIHDGNHVRGILADQMKKLFSFDQLPANSVNLQMLIDGIEIEQENQGHEASHRLWKNIKGLKISG